VDTGFVDFDLSLIGLVLTSFRSEKLSV